MGGAKSIELAKEYATGTPLDMIFNLKFIALWSFSLLSSLPRDIAGTIFGAKSSYRVKKARGGTNTHVALECLSLAPFLRSIEYLYRNG